MKKFFDKALEFLRVNRKDLAVFLLSFLLAFSIWFIHNISLRYSEILSANVMVESNIAGHSKQSSNTCRVVARCRATGYNIILNKIFRGGSERMVQIDPSLLKNVGGDSFIFCPETMPEFGKAIFDISVSSLEYYLTDTLSFIFPRENSRKVPVVPIQSVWYAPQYMSPKGVEISPDSVYVYGEASKIDDISKVFTKTIYHDLLSSDVRSSVEIEPVKGVRMSEKSVNYEINVKRYVSEKLSLPLSVKNLPAGKSLSLYPSKVNCSVSCRFPMAVEPDSLHVLYVDYNDFENSRSGKCLLRTDELPEGILEIRPELEVIECVARQ